MYNCVVFKCWNPHQAVLNMKKKVHQRDCLVIKRIIIGIKNKKEKKEKENKRQEAEIKLWLNEID